MFRQALAGRHPTERELGQGGMTTVNRASTLEHLPVPITLIRPLDDSARPSPTATHCCGQRSV
jgi:hypothetical protein